MRFNVKCLAFSKHLIKVLLSVIINNHHYEHGLSFLMNSFIVFIVSSQGPFWEFEIPGAGALPHLHICAQDLVTQNRKTRDVTNPFPYRKLPYWGLFCQQLPW